LENRKRVIALGFFDGVHLGHGALLRRATEVADRLGATPAAVTFDYHPKTFVGNKVVSLINRPEDRAWLMGSGYGIQDVILLPFDRAMMEMPWDVFVKEVLVGRFRAVHVVAGHDYRFGYKGEGNPEKLRNLCGELGIGCDIIEKVELEGITISSTHIRSLLEDGNVEEANRFLGHPHVLSGQVVRGRQVGRTIGIPTANLVIPERVLVPAYGVYATRVVTENGSYPAVTNIGIRPTVEDGRGVTVEPWILDFDGNLYDRIIRVEFYKKLRGEKKFASLEELRQEILRNAEQTRAFFAAN
jgi:riboflavin kinase/FMN adenylyltransferase